jgi:hypothetical protein
MNPGKESEWVEEGLAANRGLLQQILDTASSIDDNISAQRERFQEVSSRIPNSSTERPWQSALDNALRSANQASHRIAQREAALQQGEGGDNASWLGERGQAAQPHGLQAASTHQPVQTTLPLLLRPPSMRSVHTSPIPASVRSPSAVLKDEHSNAGWDEAARLRQELIELQHALADEQRSAVEAARIQASELARLQQAMSAAEISFDRERQSWEAAKRDATFSAAPAASAEHMGEELAATKKVAVQQTLAAHEAKQQLEEERAEVQKLKLLLAGVSGEGR